MSRFKNVENCIARDVCTGTHRVAVCRNKQYITEYYNTLEEARTAREEIKQVFSDEGQLKHSSHYYLKRVERSRKYTEKHETKLVKYGSHGKGRNMFVEHCKDCGKEVLLESKDRLYSFQKGNGWCQKCRFTHKEQIEQLVKARIASDKALKNNRTGVKNVLYIERNKAYTVAITRNGQRFWQNCKTLEEGISIKKKALNIFKQTGFLPANSSL